MFAANRNFHTFVARLIKTGFINGDVAHPDSHREVEQSRKGDVAQLVEQRTENPCVGGSIPSVTTKPSQSGGFFYGSFLCIHITKNLSFQRTIDFIRKHPVDNTTGPDVAPVRESGW
jgi:hypothetical protein